ncbi:hypothetical protein [Winogradskyella sp. 4-2091]|uniref:hypothetical protein n=1 Tax=Winogradskyella sp. 4-2091 TaxID=3381659 RepID=UPI003892A8AB
MKKKPHLLFITTSSLAANPRLVKEFEALKKDFNCFVLSYIHHDWTLELTEAIKIRNPEVQFVEIDRKNKVLQTVQFKIKHKLAILLNSVFLNSFKIAAYASNDKAPQLWLAAKKMAREFAFSRVFAHNLGAFYAAVKLSDNSQVSLQLDIEDYYPGEALYFNKKYEKRNRMLIMSHGFLKANSITYASKGIEIECEKHFNVSAQTKQATIINAFNAIDFNQPKPQDSTHIKCVWFSQHIGPNRGLEQVFEAAKAMSQVKFHLIGNKNEPYIDTMTLSSNIILHDIMSQEDLHNFLGEMDIGLALESEQVDYNRDICLTNKFLAYAQSGLYILATNTFGQSQFLNSLNYNAGLIMESTLNDSLMQINRDVLSTENKIERWHNAKLFSWENEQIKLKKLLE